MLRWLTASIVSGKDSRAGGKSVLWAVPEQNNRGFSCFIAGLFDLFRNGSGRPGAASHHENFSRFLPRSDLFCVGGVFSGWHLRWS